jgi:hypothetical protein
MEPFERDILRSIERAKVEADHLFYNMKVRQMQEKSYITGFSPEQLHQKA